MNHSIIQDPELPRMENTRFLQLLDTLIDNTIKRLEDNSVQPKIRDALKAIQLRQKVAKSSETEKIFWELLESIRTEEMERLYPRILNLEDQIIKTIIGLRQQVKNGILPVKTKADTFNQSKSKESRLSYRRIGQLLSSMGFRKAKTHAGTYAILWDDDLLFQNKFSEDEKNEKKASASPANPSSHSGIEQPSSIMVGCRNEKALGHMLGFFSLKLLAIF